MLRVLHQVKGRKALCEQDIHIQWICLNWASPDIRMGKHRPTCRPLAGRVGDRARSGRGPDCGRAPPKAQVIVVADEVVRRRSRQAALRPKTV